MIEWKVCEFCNEEFLDYVDECEIDDKPTICVDCYCEHDEAYEILEKYINDEAVL